MKPKKVSNEIDNCPNNYILSYLHNFLNEYVPKCRVGQNVAPRDGTKCRHPDPPKKFKVIYYTYIT